MDANMLLKIVYYFILSILVIGIYHSVYGWIQEQMEGYLQVSKVKKTDKIFELVDKFDSLPSEDLEKTEKMEKMEKIEEPIEIDKGVVENGEDLFQFIDSL